MAVASTPLVVAAVVVVAMLEAVLVEAAEAKAIAMTMMDGWSSGRLGSDDGSGSRGGGNCSGRGGGGDNAVVVARRP